MKFKGTKTECGIVEPNWQETSIYSKGKTIYKFKLEEEENAYNIQLIKHSKEMLEMLQYLNRRGGLGLDIHNKIEQLIKNAQ